jgi:3D (Asp-Asp-Asp) domain-containing protein
MRDEFTCSDGWEVTGYFTLIETEYTGPTRKIRIEGIGEYSFNRKFLETIETEGWGRARFGWCVGYYDNKWHKSNEPLDSLGQPLSTGSIAPDQQLIPAGSRVKIPSLPFPWDTRIFIANDIGPAIIGEHIDVYCGEGRVAEAETERITSENNQVCFTHA